MKTLSLKLPESLDQKLASAARKKGTTKSAILRSALERFVGPDSRPGKGCFLDLAGDLAGCVEGPQDLSTGARHMEGFGA